MEDTIKKNALLVVKQMRQLSGFEFGYDVKSVEWLDDYIQLERVRSEFTPGILQELIEKFGSYLGECIIWCYGGYWEKESGRWRVSFHDGNAVYPFSKVQKQFENGAEDSIKSFFDTIPAIFNLKSRKGK